MHRSSGPVLSFKVVNYLYGSAQDDTVGFCSVTTRSDALCATTPYSVPLPWEFPVHQNPPHLLNDQFHRGDSLGAAFPAYGKSPGKLYPIPSGFVQALIDDETSSELVTSHPGQSRSRYAAWRTRESSASAPS